MNTTKYSPENELPKNHFQTSSLMIIVVEDDHDDIDFLRDAIQMLAPKANVQFFTSAPLVLAFLDELPAHQKPSLFILDYNLPIITGLELLKVLQADKRFISIPKVIYTHSNREKDRNDCMNAGARAFVYKSNSLDQIRADALMILSFAADNL